MISYLKGKIQFIEKEYFVLNVNNVGYKIFCCQGFLERINKGDEVEAYIHYHQREDNVSLYGFETKQELEFFEKLISVRGLGPKSALGFFVFSINDLISSILNKDIARFTSIPGVGKKTAEMLVLQLKNKFKDFDLTGMNLTRLTQDNSQRSEVIQALESLGYSNQQAQKAVDGIGEFDDVSEAVKLCLKQIST